MRKVNRLINDFRKQTKTTIWKHLDAMAVNYAVYSTHLKGLSPFLTDYDVYLYCDATNVVVMCLDCCGHGVGAYEESESLGSLIFCEGGEPRVSTVWKVAEAVRHIKNCLSPGVSVYGVLLTEAEILNAYELERLWEANHVMVIDGFTRLKYRKIGVNADNDLACKDYVKTILDATVASVDSVQVGDCKSPTTDCKSPTTESKSPVTESGYWYDDEEFVELLEKFVSEGVGDCKSPTTDDTGDCKSPTTESPTTDDTEDCKSPTTESPTTESPTTDDTEDCKSPTTEGGDDDVYPDGEIDQNLNMSVKVEILRPIANPREELDKLVGCADIKRRMDELVALTAYNKLMCEQFPDGKRHEVSLHSVFLGRPGTGKTTVCKIFGSLLRQAGALSKGHVVVCDRGTFIGTLWGDEERSVRQVVEMARGGVLMIDEAYLLNGKHESDPGKLVIQLLMNILADETQRDLAVVLCGYKNAMTRMLDSNPGLQSRFPNKFEFTDFTVGELLEITKRRVKVYDYRFTPQAWEKYSALLTQAYQQRDPETWGNARFVANQLERIYLQHAARCVRQRPGDKAALLMLTPEDIVPIDIPRQKAKIGFF